MLADSDLPLFAWAETPERFRRAKGDPRDYRAEWDAFAAERPDVAAYICEQVERRRDAGVARIAVNVIVEHAREAFAVTINNSWRAAIADDLCERDPRLDALIERRRRKVTK